MLAALALMCLHGKVPGQHRIRTAPAVRANILVSHQDVTALGRDSDVASVQGGEMERMTCSRRSTNAVIRIPERGRSHHSFEVKGRQVLKGKV
jgi:hypothetical protein